MFKEKFYGLCVSNNRLGNTPKQKLKINNNNKIKI